MPESFDPDAWPHGGSNNPSNGRGPQKPDNDDFDPFGFDDEQPAKEQASQGNDDASFSYDFDDEPAGPAKQGSASQASSSPIATSQGYADEDDDLYSDPFGSTGGSSDTSYDDDFSFNDGYDDDFDDDFDKGYDDDFDFDREPSGGGDNKRKLMGIGAGVLLIGALGFGAVSFLGNGDTQTAAPQDDAVQGEVQSPAEQPTQEAPSAPSGDTGTPAPLPADVDAALSEALGAWGVFAVSGNLDEVRPYFVNDSQQFQKFQTESETLQAEPVEGEPFSMEMTQAEAVETDTGDWIISGVVETTRPGEVEQRFPWEIRMTRQSERDQWMVSGVRQY
jgi:hypothetical protein